MVPILGLCGVIFFIGVGASNFNLNEDVEASATDLVKFSSQISEMLQILINVATINDKDVLNAVDIESVQMLFTETEKNLHIFHEKLTALLKLKKQESMEDESKPELSATDSVPPDYYTGLYSEYATTASLFPAEEVITEHLATDASEASSDDWIYKSDPSDETEGTVYLTKSEPSGETTGVASSSTESKPLDKPIEKYQAFQYISDFINNVLDEDGSNSENPQSGEHIEFELLQDRSGLMDDSVDIPSVIPVIGIPGQDFPDYNDIPETMFTCNFKDYIPGFYADLETGCQVFHGCWSRRMESFLCPTGTIFNQQIRACDYWFNTTCLNSPEYYRLNADLAERFPSKATDDESVLSEMSDELTYSKLFHDTLSFSDQAVKFIPVLLKTTFYPKEMLTEHTPEFRKLEAFFRRDREGERVSDGEDFSPKQRSKLEIETRARKLYPELFATSGPSTDGSVPTILNENLFDSDSLISKLKPRKTVFLQRSKTDRSGLSASIIDQKLDPTTDRTPTVETDSDGAYSSSSEDPRIMKTKSFKDIDFQIAPLIVSKVLQTVDTVFNQGILPLTKDILSTSYSALLEKREKEIIF